MLGIMRKRLYAGWITLLFLLCCVLPVGAVPAPDTDELVTLSVAVDWEKEPLQDAQVTLHRVADISEDAYGIIFTLCGAFAEYPVDLKELDNDGWQAAANTLAVYAQADDISPSATALVAANGTASFADLTAGLYLMQMLPYRDAQGYEYKAMPVLLELPEYDEDHGTWINQAQAEMKLERQEPLPETTQLTVRKVWDNGAMTQPQSVRIALICDGVQQQTVELNDKNNWRYTFSNLDTKKEWSVIEVDVPDGYTVTYSTKDSVVTVTNTGEGLEPTPPPTQTPDKIPQTGVLWWPVPLLALIGLLLFALGWRLRWGNRDET